MNEKLEALFKNGPAEGQTVEEWAREIVLEDKKELEETPVEIPEESVEKLTQIIVESFGEVRSGSSPEASLISHRLSHLVSQFKHTQTIIL
jgi:hypothetical protein